MKSKKNSRELLVVVVLLAFVAITTIYHCQKLFQTFLSTSSGDSDLSEFYNLSELDHSHSYPKIWIHISNGFGEGISKWRHSVPQLLGFAKLLNATLVEPCMKSGRLYSCEKYPEGVALSHVFSDTEKYMISTAQNRAPLMATYDEFRQYLHHDFNISELKFCLHQQSCGETANYFQKPLKFLRNILYYANGTDNLVINIPFYWIHAFQINGKDMIESEPPFNKFQQQHHEKVTEFLRRANITNDEYATIHWRGEVKNMDYMNCALKIIRSREKMTGTRARPLPFLLISSINQDLDLMWGGAKQMALANNSSLEALEKLHNTGFLKLDYLMTGEEKKKLPDSGILAVYELILAARSHKFATCTRRDCRRHVCQMCNYPGGFSEFAVDYRASEGRNKGSYKCWP